jgi:hypothetical protein
LLIEAKRHRVAELRVRGDEFGFPALRYAKGDAGILRGLRKCNEGKPEDCRDRRCCGSQSKVLQKRSYFVPREVSAAV